LQPLGIHQNCGGGQSGFMATRDEASFVLEFPSRLFGICPTEKSGEYGFADVAYDRTSFGHHREKGKEYVGTQTALWGITAGVYLALMGPRGMTEVGETIAAKRQYAQGKLAAIPGVNIRFGMNNFKEFVADFTATGKSVREINRALLAHGFFGGKDLSAEFPQFGQSALYSVTEVRTKSEIDALAVALGEIARN
jgi:glycine dehydrogenase subunit 1